MPFGLGGSPPSKIKNVAPVYPPTRSRLEWGVVIIEAVIGEDDTSAPRECSGRSMLDPARSRPSSSGSSRRRSSTARRAVVMTVT